MRQDARVVVVTGGSAGLGRAIAAQFAQRGDKVAILARDEQRLASAAEELRSHGTEVLSLAVDVADWPSVRRAARQIESKLGPIDVWVNNAMVSIFAPFSEVEIKEFERVTMVDYFGFVHGTKAALESMRPRDEGVIVQVGSALAFRSIPLQSAYCGAKHAIAGFTESLRTELLHDKSKVRVTMVTMPAMNTPQFDWVRSRLPARARPVAPIYEPELAAKAVIYAADHPKRRTFNVGGSTSLTIVANKLLPGALDHYLARTGYKSQQRPHEPEDPSRADNLFEPVAGDFGAHGDFDATAHRHSLQLWLSLHRRAFAGACAGLSVLLGGFVRRGELLRALRA